MPAGRPRKGRPLGGPRAHHRQQAELAVSVLRSDAALEGLPPAVRAFLLEICDHYIALDEQTLEDVAKLKEEVASDSTITEVAKAALNWLLNSVDNEDSAGRMQIRTLACSGLLGKPPEAPKGGGPGSMRRLPGGQMVQVPDLSDMTLP